MFRVVGITILLLLSPFNIAKTPAIGTSKAMHYDLASKELVDGRGYNYIFACIVSQASNKEERAQTMVKAIIDIEKETPNKKIALYLAPDKRLCKEGRLTGTSYYSPDGSGWKGVAGGSWTWNILTTGVKITDQQISDTVLYESHISKFKKKYGIYDYSDKLDDYVTSQLGRKPTYINSGLWIDTYHFE